MKVDEILELSPVQRRRIRMWGPPRRRKREVRPSYSRDELVDWLRRTSVRSSRVLARTRKQGDPTLYDFRKAFVTWNKAVEAAFGKNPFEPEVTSEYILKAAAMFDVWNPEDYAKERKANPEVFPSIGKLKKMFGSFREFVHLARERSLDKTRRDFMALWRKLGRRPLVEDCKTAGIALDRAMAVFKSKAKFDEFACSLDRIGEKVRGEQ